MTDSSSLGLTTAELFALLEEDILRLEGATAGTGFELKHKMLRTEALALAVYAQVGIDEGDKALTKKLALARNGALGFANAAKIGDREGAGRAIALAKEFRSGLSESQPRSIHIPLDNIIPLTNLMEQAGLLGAAMTEYETVPFSEWSGPEHRGAVLRNTWRMSALVRAMERHVPETDPNPRKGQTRKLWQETLRDCRQEMDALLTAARSNAPADYVMRYKALDAACNRCHSAYRVE